MPLEIMFYDKVFDNLYKKEINTSATTVFMAILAVLISLIGVVGMVTFDTEFQRNEISVRRTFGATTVDIFKRINIKYILIIAIGFVLSLPITYYITGIWQKNFVEKVSLPWWVSLLILLSLTLVTVIIVTFQSAKTVYSNPIDGLKKE